MGCVWGTAKHDLSPIAALSREVAEAVSGTPEATAEAIDGAPEAVGGAPEAVGGGLSREVAEAFGIMKVLSPLPRLLPSEEDRSKLLEAVRWNVRDLQKPAFVALCSDRDFMLQAVRLDGQALKYASTEIRMDRDLVLEALGQDGHALKHASEELKGDRELGLAAVRQHSEALEEVRRTCSKVVFDTLHEVAGIEGTGLEASTLRGDRSFVLEAVQLSGIALHDIEQTFGDDRGVVQAAVRQNGIALKWASEALCNDKELVLEAVRQHGMALKAAAERLQHDPEVVHSAVIENGNALEFASAERQADRELVKLALRQGKRKALHFAAPDCRADRELAMEAVRLNGNSLEFVGEEFKNDREIVLDAIRQNRKCLRHAAADVLFDSSVTPENPIALHGSQAPIFNVMSDTIEDQTLKFIACSIAGTEHRFELPADTTLGDFGSRVAEVAGRKVVFLLFRGNEIASPFDIHKPLHNFVGSFM